MLIGSEITCVCFLDILHKVHIGGGESLRQRQFRLKFLRPETTPTSAKARSAQVLRNSPLAMPLAGSNLPHSVVEEGIILYYLFCRVLTKIKAAHKKMYATRFGFK